MTIQSFALVNILEGEETIPASGVPGSLYATQTGQFYAVTSDTTLQQFATVDFAALVEYAADAAAAIGGVAVGSLYRTGSAVMVRVA